jgi:hypothetical protein
MQVKQSLSQQKFTRNGHDPSTAFEQAFCPQLEDNQIKVELLIPWNLNVSKAISVLIQFYSALLGWQATGDITNIEFMAKVQKMSQAGLWEWLNTNPLRLDDLQAVTAIR